MATPEAAIRLLWQALDRSPTYGGDCDTAPTGTVCSWESGPIGSYESYLLVSVDATTTGTAVLQHSAGKWRPVAFDLVVYGWYQDADYQVVGTVGCLMVRAGPSAGSASVGCLTSGTVVRITGDPAYDDGFIWAPTNKGGWCPLRWIWLSGTTPTGEISNKKFVYGEN